MHRLCDKWRRLSTDRRAGVRPTDSMDSGLRPPAELGELWGLSSETIRRLFEDEPGVLMIEPASIGACRRVKDRMFSDQSQEF
jgi:hypothetical protein